MPAGGAATGLLPEWLLRSTLYASGPFFSFPHKPVLAVIEGASYERAYAHFRRDHSNPANLAAHCLALVYQLGSNFALLNELDRWLASGSRSDDMATPSRLTAIVWASCLAAGTSAPMPVRLASAAAVGLAFSQRAKLENRWCDLSSIVSVIEAFAIHYVVLRRPIRDWRGLAVAVLARSAVQYVAVSHRGRLARYRRPVAAAVLIAVAFAGLLARTKLHAFRYALAAAPLSVVTNDPLLWWWSNAFVASLLQGAAHRATGELATLPQLGDNVADELAHTGYFPSLLLQSVSDSVAVAAA